MESRSTLNAQIYQEACQWFLEFRMEEPDATARSRFDTWMRRSPDHVAAYLEVAAIWSEPAAHDRQGKWDTDTLITQSMTEPENVVPLTQPTVSSPPRREPVSQTQVTPPTRQHAHVFFSRRLSQRVALAIAASIVGGLVGLYAWHARAPVYATDVGEQRLVTLADGSTIELNARTRLVVRYSERERVIDLLAGQAMFQVAPDRARAFVVRTGETRVQAIGTQFVVYRKRANTVITVVEGRVAVRSQADGGTSSSEALDAGEQLIVAPRAQERPEHPDISGATAWLRRKIVFEAAPLSEVAEEFNRYSERQLIIEDSALQAFRLSGVFSSSDLASVIRFIRERPGIRVIETPAEIRVRKDDEKNSL
jgi:transmembrane sensor